MNLFAIDAGMAPGTQEADHKSAEPDGYGDDGGERRIGNGCRDTGDNNDSTQDLHPAIFSQRCRVRSIRFRVERDGGGAVRVAAIRA